MRLKKVLMLYTMGMPRLQSGKRYYTSQNVLSLYKRGMFQDIFPTNSSHEIEKLLVGSPQCVYAGFDPTADSLHIGNLLVLINLLHWQRAGHQVIAVLGEATGKIGDPSHRAKERDEMNTVIISQNINKIKKNIEVIFDNHEKYLCTENCRKMKPPIILNNMDWYQDINVIDFIRGVGKYFRLGTMMGRSSVQSRLNAEGGMSFTEFSYQTFQAYDWLYLKDKYNCRFQIGGNDQLGNIVSGYDLISKSTGKTVYGLTLPLITSEGGKKFGKSLGNALWLSSKKSSSFNFYQFFVRIADADIEKYLKLFSFFSIGEIDEIMKSHNTYPEQREAQKILARQMTLLAHGEKGLEAALTASSVLYDNSIQTLSKLNSDEIMNIFEGAIMTDLPLEYGLSVYDLVTKIKCFKSDQDALRIISAGGFQINHSKITNIKEVITPGIHILPNNLTLVRVGKKSYHIVRWIE